MMSRLLPHVAPLKFPLFFASFILLIISIWTVGVSHIQAQDDLGESTCETVRYMMEREITPYDLDTGGGILQPGQAQTSAFSSDYYVDTWTFSVVRQVNASGLIDDPGLEVVYNHVDPGLQLEAALFSGMEMIADSTRQTTYQPVTEGITATYPVPRDGVYTLVIRRADVRNQQAGSYTFTPTFSPGGEITVTNLRNNTTSRMLDVPPTLAEGKTVIPVNGTEVRVHPGSVGSVGTPSVTTVQVRFGGGGNFGLLIGNTPEQISLFGGDLAVSAAQGRKFYLKDFGYAVDLVDGQFMNVEDSNGTRIRLSWEIMKGVWVTDSCAGFKLLDGRTFTGVLVPSQRDVTFQGNENNFTIRVITPHDDGRAVAHQLSMNWYGIAPDVEMQVRDGKFRIPFAGDHLLELSSTQIDMRRTTNGDEGTEHTPVNIELRDIDASLRLDWINLRQLTLADGVIAVQFEDSPRTSTTRSAANLLRLEALGDVIQIVYRDGPNGVPGEQRLILPAEESYIEIVTPAGLPQFNGRALPGEAGFAPRGLNNLGAECHPINTLLPEANCPPNGYPNPVNQNVWYAVTDHRAYGGLVNLDLTRSYNRAAASVNGPFGYGWTTAYLLDYDVPFDETSNTRIVNEQSVFPVGLDLTWAPRGYVTFNSPTGSQHVFVSEGNNFISGTLTALTMPRWTLSRATVRDGWTLRQDSGFTYEFDRAGRLAAYGYPQEGRLITVYYPPVTLSGAAGIGEGALVFISDAPDLRRLELYYDDEHHIVRSVLRDVSAVDDPDTMDTSVCDSHANCYETRYGYENGYLTEVIYPDGSRATYEYGENSKLVAHDDPRAPIAPRMVYSDAENGTLTIDVVLADDSRSRWRVVSPTRTNDEEQTFAVGVTDEYNNLRTYTYAWQVGSLKTVGSSFTLLSETSPLRDVTTFETVPIQYEWANGLLQRRLPRLVNEITGRNSIVYEYTGAGYLNRVRSGYPSFSATYQEFRADASSPLRYLPQTLTFANYGTQTFTYNDLGWVDTMTDPLGGEYGYDWNANHRLSTLISVSDSTAEDYEYNDLGLVSTYTKRRLLDETADWYTVRYEYDGIGRLSLINDPLTGAYTFDYNYTTGEDDATYWQVAFTDATSTIASIMIDSRGNIAEERLAPAGSDVYLRRTTYVYDVFNRLQSETRWLAPLFDDEVTQQQITTYSYGGVAALASLPGDESPANRVINGYQVSRTDAYGRTRTFTYDALGRIRQVNDEVNAIARFDYDVPEGAGSSSNLRIVQRDIRNNVLIARTEYLFDVRWQLRQVTRITDDPETPEIWELFYEGDTSRLQALRGRPGGVIEQGWGLLNAGHPASMTRAPVPIALNSGSSLPGVTLSAEFDFRGRPLVLSNGAGQGSYAAYCPQANGGEAVVYSTQPGISCDQGSRTIHYDAQGRLVRVDDPVGSRKYTYTPLEGRWQVDVSFEEASWQLLYDGAGNLVQWQDESGLVRVYAYDSLGHLRRIEVDDRPEASFTFQYNIAGYLTSELDDLGRGTRYAYDDLGRLNVEQDARTANATIYSYDTQGRLATIISPLGNTTTFLYDEPQDPNRLTGVIDPTGSTAQFEWDDINNRLIYVDPRGSRTVYHFDSTDALWRIDDALGRSHEFLYDGYGTLTEWRQAQPQQGNAARNMVLERTPTVLSIAESTAQDWQRMFNLNASGQVTSINAPWRDNQSYAYDALGRLTRAGAGSKTWTLMYEAGRPALTYSDGFGNTHVMQYDVLNRLVSDETTTADGESALTTYSYQRGRGAEVDLTVTDTSTRVYTFSSGDDSSRPPSITERLQGRRTTFLYDAEGLVTEITSEACVVPTEIVDPLRPDDCVRVGAVDDIWRKTERIVYDVMGRPARYIDAEQNIESFAYDDSGNLTSYQNINGQTFSYTYDALNRLESLVGPAGIRILLRYGSHDRVTGICRDRVETRRTFDECVRAGGLIESYTYDSLGRIASQNFTTVNGDTSFMFDYDDLDVSWGTGSTLGVTVGRTSDGLSLIESIQVDDLEYPVEMAAFDRYSQAGETLTYEYDAAGRLVQVTDTRGSTIYQYPDSDGGYQIVDEANEVTMTFRLDEHGFLSAVGTDQLDYFLNPDGRILVAQFARENGELVELRLNRRNETETIVYTISNLFVDYVNDAAGQVQRQSIIGFPEFFERGIGGYIAVIGYDNDSRPLTIRVTDRDSGVLLHLVTFTYDALGQRVSETQQYQDGTQITLTSRYGAGNQLIRRDIIVIAAMTQTLNASPALALMALIAWLLRSRTRRQTVIFVTVTGALTLLSLSLSGAQQVDERLTQTFYYDGRGNLIRIDGDGGDSSVTCARYEYDSANRLVQSRQGDLTQQYRYDAFNRLSQINEEYLLYQGDTPILLGTARVDEAPTLYGQTSDLPTLFQMHEDQTRWLIHDGRRNILAANTLEESTGAVWLFDPLGRYLSFNPSITAGDVDPCLVAPLPDDLLEISPLQVRTNRMIWDATANLYFINGRAYAPQLGRFLQRDPQGPDAFGNIYNFPTRQTVPPRRVTPPAYMEGLYRLRDSMRIIHATESLGAANVLADHQPMAPLQQIEPLVGQLDSISTAVQNRINPQLDFPVWLAWQYSLPGAYIDPTGLLRLTPDNAPGQGGTRTGLEAIQTGYDPAADWIPVINPPSVRLQNLFAMSQPQERLFATYDLYQWQPSAPYFPGIWEASAPELDIAHTPAAIWQWLPQTLRSPEQATLVLDAVQGLDLIAREEGAAWLQTALNKALPELPPYPPESSAAWMRNWFTPDTFGSMEVLSVKQFLPSLGNIPVYHVGVNNPVAERNQSLCRDALCQSFVRR